MQGESQPAAGSDGADERSPRRQVRRAARRPRVQETGHDSRRRGRRARHPQGQDRALRPARDLRRGRPIARQGLRPGRPDGTGKGGAGGHHRAPV
ncbi:MAG: hypothetical protein ACK55Z_00200, partial [bacterium]